MRYYAEWLDGEYIILNHAIRGYDHQYVMERAIKFHALLGSTIVLSDVQMIDFKCPIPALFHDDDFRNFLYESQKKRERDFLALVADPVPEVRDRSTAIAMKGLYRLSKVENAPPDSFEAIARKMVESILRAGHFDAEKHLSANHRQRDQIGRLISRSSPNHKRNLRGILHALDYFSRNSLGTTTAPSLGRNESYDTLLKWTKDKLLLDAGTSQRSLREDKLIGIQNRVGEILRIQEEHLVPEQHGRRNAIRRVLGDGPLYHEKWKPEKLMLYLDVVHAWNYVVNRNIAPEAGTLYESRNDIPLSGYEGTVTDTIEWFQTKRMPTAGLSDRICRLLGCDLAELSWKQIAGIARQTSESAKKLQASLKSGSKEDRAEALIEHAELIGEALSSYVQIKIELPQFVWWIAKGVAEYKDIPSETVDLVEEEACILPYKFATMQKKAVVNTIKHAGSQLL